MTAPARPPAWTDEQFRADAERAVQAFREVRLREPLERYLEIFSEYQGVVREVIVGTRDLAALKEGAVACLSDPDLLTVVRYLASPAISEDDLKVLAQATLTPSRLREDEEMAGRVLDTVLLALDRSRFPWVAQEREATQDERWAAIVSTTALIATQRVQTERRSASKDGQETRVASYLEENGLRRAGTRQVRSVSDLPVPGEFCRESQFGSRKADFVVRLWDGRTMPVECKVSNSSTNSVKRLNNDAAVKAVTWLREFGSVNTVPVAVLSGVFKVHNLRQAQDQGLSIFWEHSLQALGEFVDATRG